MTGMEYYGFLSFFRRIQQGAFRQPWDDLSDIEQDFWVEYVNQYPKLKDLDPGKFFNPELVQRIDGLFWNYRKHDDAWFYALMEDDGARSTEEQWDEFARVHDAHWTNYARFRKLYLKED